jgi:hypothetical protein
VQRDANEDRFVFTDKEAGDRALALHCRSSWARLLQVGLPVVLSDLGAEKLSPGSWEGWLTLLVTCHHWLGDRQLSGSDATDETEVTEMSQTSHDA